MGAYSAAVLADTPLYYWRLNTPGGAFPGSATNWAGFWWPGGASQHHFVEGWSGVDSTGRSVLVDGGGIQVWDTRYMPVVPFAWDFWFFSFNTGNLAPNPTVFLQGTTASVSSGYIQYQSNPQLIVTGDRTGITSSGTAITSGQWHHIALVFDASNLTYWYLDGVPIAGGSSGATYTILSAQWLSPQAGTPWLFTELAYYAHLLTATQVANHYAAGVLTSPVFQNQLAACG